RLWLGESAEADDRVARLGPDAHEGLPTLPHFSEILSTRGAPIKAVLLDQATLSGIGNWIADEVLYHAGIAPARLARSLSQEEIARLREEIKRVIEIAIEAECEYTCFPDHWLFTHRWGGKRGAQMIGDEEILRERIAGRTTAWVPSRQR
ncbi:MAG: hypothetical protein C4320_08160, partial [Armatimonadota bacterium]